MESNKNPVLEYTGSGMDCQTNCQLFFFPFHPVQHLAQTHSLTLAQNFVFNTMKNMLLPTK